MKKITPCVRLLSLILMLAFATPVLAQQGPGYGPNFEPRLSSLEDQMRILNGQIEQLNFSIKRMDLALQRIQGDYDARLTKLESDQAALQQTLQAQAAALQAATTPPPATPTVTASAAEIAEINGSLGAIKTQNGKVTGAVNNPKAPPLPDAPPDYGLTPQEQYERAFDILRKADYAEAEKAFKGFIEKNPKDKLVDNAKYWYGETLYVQNKYNEATIAFVDAYQQNPKGSKAPDSLLKLALSLNSMNKTPEACTTLSELKAKYPKASASVRSRTSEELSKLKCDKT